MGMLENLSQKPLRCLYGPQGRAIGSRQDATLVVDHLDRVGHCQTGDDGGVACTYGLDHPGEQVGRGQTPGCIVNQDDSVVVAQRRQSCRHRGAAIGAPCHDLHPEIQTGDVAGLLKVGARSHDHDVSDLLTTQNAP
jgi:hypothetical protein